ncbi:MAG TPA: LacI family DNA-binding transcriptional regulator [Gemmatimonadaceae bacterium]
MVTIKDVARAAGVSAATVSRVWNDSAVVSEDTRRHVREVAARLGYSPHGAARSLITRTTRTIGVLLPDLYGEFFSEVIRGIDQTAQQHGFHLLVSSSHDSRSEIEAALRSMRGRVDGLIVMSPDLDAQGALHAIGGSFPVVLLNAVATGESFDSITIDNRGGAAAMVRHLVALGHRRIAMIAGPERNYDSAERLAGYREALAPATKRADRSAHASLVRHGDFSEASGHRAARAFLELEPRPSAIFAANDSMAIGALSALHEAGLRVPEDVAVVGFDDIPMARYMNPPLTSVHVDISDLGHRATERLLELLAGPAPPPSPRQETVPAALVVRGSCGGGSATTLNR